MKVLISFLLLVLSACGRVDYPVHPAAEELRATFVREANARGFDLREEDVPLALVGPVEGESVMGACLHGSGQIVISEAWRNEGAPYLEALAMHEYGHCVLDLRHADERSLDIMSPYGVGHDDYWENRELLIDRLFVSARK